MQREMRKHRAVRRRAINEQMEKFNYKDSAINFGITDPTFRQAILDHDEIKKNIESEFEDKFKKTTDFLKDQERREPDHTITAERVRLHLDESLFANTNLRSKKMMNESANGYIGMKVVFEPINFDPGFGYDTDDTQLKAHIGKNASVVSCDIDNGNYEDSYWTIEFEDGYILDGIEGCDTNKIHESQQRNHRAAALTEVLTNFDYEKYYMTEEATKEIVDELMSMGIDPWLSGSKEDMTEYFEKEMGMNPEDIPGLYKCVFKYCSEHRHTSTVWDTVYNELVSGAKESFTIFKDKSGNGKQGRGRKKGGINLPRYDEISLDEDGFVVKGVTTSDFDYVKQVAEFYGLKTEGPTYTGEGSIYYNPDREDNYHIYRFKIFIPDTIAYKDVYDYLDSIQQ